MHPTSFLNKLEILLYSSLINIMSGINQLKTQDQNISKSPVQPDPEVNIDLLQTYDQLPERSISISWVSIQQAFLSLLLWMVLGFAAGFLVGMIKTG